MKRLMILGHSGFLGQWSVASLRDRPAFDLILPDRADWDLLDPASLRRLMETHRPDLVINLAAKAHVGSDTEGLYAVNARGQLNLLEVLAATGFSGHHLFVSTANVYGAADNDFLTENTRPLPLNHYSCAKLLAEHYCAMMAHDVATTIIRPFSVIGRGQAASFLLPKLVHHFATRAPVLELGNSDVRRDFIDVRDFCRMLTCVLKADALPPIINLSNAEVASIDEILEILGHLSGHRPDIRINPAFVRVRDIHYQCGDNSMIKSLGYRRKFTIEQTLEWLLKGGNSGE